MQGLVGWANILSSKNGQLYGTKSCKMWLKLKSGLKIVLPFQNSFQCMYEDQQRMGSIQMNSAYKETLQL